MALLPKNFTIRDIKQGVGPIIEPGDRIRLIYKMALTEEDLDALRLIDGDPSGSRATIVDVREGLLLPGVFSALVGMRTGGAVRRATIPPTMAFGDRQWRGIPAGSTIYLEILAQYRIVT